MTDSEHGRAFPPAKSVLVLVTGVTGQQGGHVARQLLRRGHRVRGLARNRDSAKLKELEGKGLEVVLGSFEEPTTLQAAARGVDAMFLMGTPAAGPEAEARQGIAAIDAAKRAGVPWLVYSSVSDADRATGIPHFDSKFEVERHLRGSGIPYVISAPTAFMENLLLPFQLSSLRQGRLVSGTSPDRTVQVVALDDLGAFVTHLLENPVRFRGQRINVASDAVSQAETARLLSELSGRPITYQQIPLEALRQQSADHAKMFEFFEGRGYTAAIEGLRREYPQVGWHRFREWAAEQDWPHLLS